MHTMWACPVLSQAARLIPAACSRNKISCHLSIQPRHHPHHACITLVTYTLIQDPDGKECDGCWEETFLGHTDSKPMGPEAMSVDISFPGEASYWNAFFPSSAIVHGCNSLAPMLETNPRPNCTSLMCLTRLSPCHAMPCHEPAHP